MSYKNYPPGLARRLRYSIELYERRRSSINQNVTVQPFNYTKGLVFEKLLHNSVVGVVLHKFNDTTVCPICIEPFIVYDIYRTLVCNHTFHIACIDRWFVDNQKCPFCRHCI
jgi:Ring finger domain